MSRYSGSMKPDRRAKNKQFAHTLRCYDQLNKKLLHQEAAPILREYRNALEQPNSCFYRQVGGWMLTEAALVQTNLDTGERHDLLDKAEEDWQIAREMQYKRDLKKLSHSYFLPSVNMLRLDYNLAALDVFRGMVDQDVTQEHRARYYESLLHLGVKASEAVEFFGQDLMHTETRRGAENYLGIAHEINASLAINRLGSPTLMSFPALPRSDSGHHNPKETHDLQLFQMHWGTIEGVLGAEVKTTLQDRHYKRYKAALIGGSLHLHPQNRRTPIALTELLAKESRGIATEQDITHLDAITDNVVHVARHGFTNTPQCRDITTCTAIPRSRK